MAIAADLCLYTNHNTTEEVFVSTKGTEGETKEKPILGYWKIRGKGHQIKYLLAYLGVAYENK